MPRAIESDIPTCPKCGSSADLHHRLPDDGGAQVQWVCPQCGEDLVTEVRISVTYVTAVVRGVDP